MLKVDWSRIDKQFNYVVKDTDGKVYAYKTKPFFNAHKNKWVYGTLYSLLRPSIIIDGHDTPPAESLISRQQAEVQHLTELSDNDLLESFYDNPKNVSIEMTKRLFSRSTDNTIEL